MWRLVWAKLVGSDGKPYSSTNPLPITGTITATVDTTALEGLTGSKTETAPASDTASSGLNGRLQRIAQRLTALIALLPAALGAGGGLKVDGSGTALPVSAAALPLPSGAATEATLDARTGALTETAPASDTASSGLNGRLQRVAQRLTSLITVTPALGTAAMAASSPVTLATDDTVTGAKTETAPASDTASSGLNGRLQRIAQRLTSLIALLPASLGIKAASASLSVAAAGYQYKTVAASQTAVVMGATGATGDYLSHVVIQPATTAAGTVTVLDNATVIYTFTTGTLSDLKPITVPIGAFSVSGAWKITTGANVAAVGFGNFT